MFGWSKLNMDNEVESTRSSTRLPSFSGVTKDFMVWWARFRAFATARKFAFALGDADEADLPAREDAAVLDAAVEADQKKVAARKKNAVAMADHSMAFTNKTNLGMSFKAIAAGWPAGKASTVTRLLKAKQVPQDPMT
jgi:hypothetical protein